jgi:two-component system sensor histidine kinase KdpD
VGDDVNELSLAVSYPLLVLAVSGLWGVVPGLATAVASALAVNWFFIAPVHTLTVDDARDWVSLGVLAATALITGHLAGGFRRQRAEAEERRRDAELLAGMAEAVAGGIGAGPPGPGVAEAAARALGVDWCRVELGPDGTAGREPVAVVPSPSGFAVPLVGGGRPLGLLVVGPARAGAEPRWATPGFAEAVAGLTAVAVERGRLIAQALEAESLRRSDELKTALLHSVSHEFRTPLTAIRTATDALATAGAPDGGTELLAVLAEETARLDRLVGNLLDLSRLEAGALVARTDWCAPAEMAAAAVEAAAPLLGGAEVLLDVPDTLPLVRADPVLCERILVNLLHNAVRHGRSPIRVTGVLAGNRVEIAVSDAGPGLSAAVAPVVLEPFTAEGPGGGTGVGLALARGLADAQGAVLRAPEAGGSRFVLSFPPAPVPQVVS